MMKLSIIPLALGMFSNSALFAQAFDVYPSNAVVYNKHPTEVSAYVKGYSCESILLKATNGVLKRDGCRYLYTANSIGKGAIEVFVKQGAGLRRVGTKILAVREAPMPFLQVGGSKGGAISIGNFKAQAGVSADLFITEWHEAPIQVLAFSVIGLQKGEIVFHSYNVGNGWTEHTKNSIKSLQSGDRVVMAGAHVLFSTNDTLNVLPAEFLLID